MSDTMILHSLVLRRTKNVPTFSASVFQVFSLLLKYLMKTVPYVCSRTSPANVP